MLGDNHFEWRKFTDQVPIGADGEVADPFPGYPMSGTFRQERGRVEFESDGGSQIDDHFMIEHLGAHYLLTEEQHQKFIADGDLQNCVLRLVTVE